MKFRYKTGDGRAIVPTICLRYECKGCGYFNELVLLTAESRQFAEPGACVPHESLCHKCDDVEVITVEFGETK
jgi:hypothetical protein